MTRRSLVKCGLVLLAAGVGCNRQDADCLARIGNLLMQRAQTLKEKSTAKTRLAQTLPGLGGTAPVVGAANVNGDAGEAK